MLEWEFQASCCCFGGWLHSPTPWTAGIQNLSLLYWLVRAWLYAKPPRLTPFYISVEVRALSHTFWRTHLEFQLVRKDHILIAMVTSDPVEVSDDCVVLSRRKNNAVEMLSNARWVIAEEFLMPSNAFLGSLLNKAPLSAGKHSTKGTLGDMYLGSHSSSLVHFL